MPVEAAEVVSGWLLDEMAGIVRENLDATHVSRYAEREDANTANEMELRWTEGLGPPSTVVDLGTSTGRSRCGEPENGPS